MLFRFSRLTLICIAATLGFSACGDDGPPMEPPPPTPGDAQWRWVAPVARADAGLWDIWGSSADNLFAVGAGGVVLRYDGASWRRTQTPSSRALKAIWGTSSTHIVAVGDEGTIFVFNGTSWAQQNSGTDVVLLDVWGTSPTDIFVVGTERSVLHYDGASWSPMIDSDVGQPALNGVWGSSATDVYATGLGTNLFHYDGGDWQLMTTPATHTLGAVWGTGASDIFAVGVQGAAIRYDGVSWEVIDAATSSFFSGVWGRSATEVYAWGANGYIYLWDGDSWSPTVNPSIEEVGGLFGADGRTFSVGQEGALLELEGGEWVYAPEGRTEALDDAWIAPDGAAYFVGEQGTILRWRDGTLESMASGTAQRLRGIHGTSGTDIIAVGRLGTVLRYDGNSWSASTEGPGYDLLDVWMLSSSDAFITGQNGLVLRLEGGSWNDYTPSGVVDSLNAVWAPDPDHVYVVGSNSRGLTWNGSQWKLLFIDTFRKNNYHAIFGTSPSDYYVGAEYLGTATGSSVAGSPALHAGGLIYHWSNGSWTIPYQDPIHDLLGVWAATTDEVFACGDAKSLLIGSSEGFSRVTDFPGLPDYLRSVWGSSPTNVFVVGDNGTIARYSR